MSKLSKSDVAQAVMALLFAVGVSAVCWWNATREGSYAGYRLRGDLDALEQRVRVLESR